jgi:hypothetical protein
MKGGMGAGMGIGAVYELPERSWILCRSKHNRQEWASENIRRVRPDYEVYLPRYYDPDLRKVVFMFGNYMFVRAVAGQWHCLSGVWGLSCVVLSRVMEEPYIVIDSEINRIKGMEDKNGVVKMALRRLQPGARIIITAGPLQFCAGWFKNHSRRGFVVVEVDGLLGKSAPVELEQKIVSPM